MRARTTVRTKPMWCARHARIGARSTRKRTYAAAKIRCLRRKRQLGRRGRPRPGRSASRMTNRPPRRFRRASRSCGGLAQHPLSESSHRAVCARGAPMRRSRALPACRSRAHRARRSARRSRNPRGPRSTRVRRASRRRCHPNVRHQSHRRAQAQRRRHLRTSRLKRRRRSHTSLDRRTFRCRLYRHRRPQRARLRRTLRRPREMPEPSSRQLLTTLRRPRS